VAPTNTTYYLQAISRGGVHQHVGYPPELKKTRHIARRRRRAAARRYDTSSDRRFSPLQGSSSAPDWPGCNTSAAAAAAAIGGAQPCARVIPTRMDANVGLRYIPPVGVCVAVVW